jgi:hypothetical protein
VYSSVVSVCPYHHTAATVLHQPAGKAELTRTQQKVDGLQTLSSTLQNQNKVGRPVLKAYR